MKGVCNCCIYICIRALVSALPALRGADRRETASASCHRSLANPWRRWCVVLWSSSSTRRQPETASTTQTVDRRTQFHFQTARSLPCMPLHAPEGVRIRSLIGLDTFCAACVALDFEALTPKTASCPKENFGYKSIVRSPACDRSTSPFSHRDLDARDDAE